VSDPDLGGGVDARLADAPDAIVGVGPEPELSEAALSALPAEVFAQSLNDYFSAWARRLRNGESGALPTIGGLIAVMVFFQLEQSTFLSSTNLVNLFVAASIYVMFGAAELPALLLSEIDLSVGYAGAVAAFIIAELNQPPVNLPWWIGVIAGVGFVFAFGGLQGFLITRFGLPSFVVTLGGLLALEGIMLELATIDKTALGGVISLNGASPVYKLAGSVMSPALSWIVLVVALILMAVGLLARERKKRVNGLASSPTGVTLLTIALTAIGGIVLVLICNGNTPSGVPWVVPFVVIVLSLFAFVLSRTKLGRYIYAIGANPEAVRRAGVNVPLIRTIGFATCGGLAGLAGMVYESRLGSISTDIDGGQIVLYAVAAAVIGGASLFGGKGRPLNALLGGMVIAVVVDGLGLMGVGTGTSDIITAGVLIAAVMLDSLVRRRATAGLR
jgi:D-xylose transport system permease protein